MTRIQFTALGLLALGACTADTSHATPDGLVVAQRSSELVAGTFSENGVVLNFDFSDRNGDHEAVLTGARGAYLEDVVFVDGGIDGTSFVEAILLDKAWVISVPGDPASRTSGDPSVFGELAARPEMQLVAPLEAALSDMGMETRTASTAPTPTLPSVDLYVNDGSIWSWSTIYLAAAP